MSNPKEFPSLLKPPVGRRRTLAALVPFAIAIPGLIVAFALWFWSPFPGESNSIAFGIVGAILVFDLPVCVLVGVEWLATGMPPKLSLSPLVPTLEERKLRRIHRERPKLNDDEFYDNFYAGSPVPKELAIRLRALLERQLGLTPGALHPNDNLIFADPELDWTYLVEEINDEFNILISGEKSDRLDGTFDNLLQCISRVAAGN